MIRMIRRVLSTFLTFVVINSLLHLFAGIVGITENTSIDKIILKAIIISVFYLTFVFIYTRKHDYIVLILFAVALMVVVLVPIKIDTIIQKDLILDVSLGINIVILMIQSFIAKQQALKYKQEEKIRIKEGKKTIYFEELDKDGNVIRKGKTKHQ